MRLLLVEDYPPLVRSLGQGLRESGFAVDVAADGEAGLSMAGDVSYDAIVLDLMLPRLDGYAVLERLRGSRNEAAVVVLTARQELADRIKGLDLGADDYVVKPFSFDELVARIRSVIRRRQGQPRPVITVGDLVVDVVARRVKRGSRAIALSSLEFALLEALAMRRGQVVTRAELCERVYDLGQTPSSNVIDVYVGYLRRKIDEGSEVRLIRTHRGMGYSLGDPDGC